MHKSVTFFRILLPPQGREGWEGEVVGGTGDRGKGRQEGVGRGKRGRIP